MLTIRRAVLRDAKAMMEVHREAVFAKAAGHYSRAILEAWAPGATTDRVVQVGHEIADPAFIVLVAEAAGDLIGFAMAIPTNGELRAVYVKPNRVGGVGRALLAEIEGRAFALADQLACDASLNAEEFYKANGYQAEAPIRHVLRRGTAIPCIRMSKRRPGPRVIALSAAT
jgi:GNAT superfamily N-acetyltransferase